MRYLVALLGGVGLCLPMAQAFPKLPPAAVRPQESQRLLLLKALDGTPEEQLKALDGLLGASPSTNVPYVPLLIRVLETSESLAVQQHVARMLATIGPEAKNALPMLRKLFREYGRSARDFANAMAQISEGNDPEVIRWLCLANTEGRSKSPVTLRPYLDQYARTVLPILGDLLSDPDPNLRYRVLRQLKTAVAARDNKAPSPIADLSAEAQAKLLQQLQRVYRTTDNHRANISSVAFAADIALRMKPALFEELLPLYLLRIRSAGMEAGDFAYLVQVQPDAADRLVAQFDDPNETFRERLMYALRNTPTPVVQQALRRGLHHRNPLVRLGVLQTVRPAELLAKALTPYLAPSLCDPTPKVRLLAATILRRQQSPDAAAIVPVLMELVATNTKPIRDEALRQLTLLGPKAKEARALLLRLNTHTDLDTRFLAAEALYNIDPTTTATVMRTFAAMAKQVASDDCERAVKLLGACGPAAKPWLSALRPALDYHDLRIHACMAMWMIDPTCTEEIVGVLGQALNVNDSECYSVLEMLPKFGAAAKGLIPTLKALMYNDEDDEIAAKAATAVIALDPKQADEAYLLFRSVLTNTRSSSTMWLRQLRELGPAAKPLLPELITATRSPRPNTRRYAIETLGLLGPAAKDALPALREAVKANNNGPHLDEAIKKIEGNVKP